VVIPAMPHHVTQRGNWRQRTFFSDEDYAAYSELMAQWCAQRRSKMILGLSYVEVLASPKHEQKRVSVEEEFGPFETIELPS
jgi:putative transposase